MNLRNKSLRALGATVVLMGLAVAAFAQIGPGEDPNAIAIVPDDPSTTTQQETTSSPDAPTTTTPEPFIYRVGVLSGVSTDNFWAFYGEEASVWNSYILGPTKPALFKIDPMDGGLTPELAVDTERARFDGEKWFVEIDLRRSLNWSDGKRIRARDMEFTFDTVRDLGLGGSWATAFPPTVTDVRATSQHSLRIEFGERPTLAVWPHAVGIAPVMPEHVWRKTVDGTTVEELYQQSGSRDVGGGPLFIGEITDLAIRSIANPGYALASTPDEVEYHVFADEATAVGALGDGAIEVILTPKGLSTEDSAPVEAIEGVALETSPANGVRYLGFNLDRQPMADLAFRRAIALLLDRQRLAETIADGSQVAHSFVREANELWYDERAAGAIGDMYAGDLGPRLEGVLEDLRDSGYVWDSEPVVSEDGALQPGTGLRIRGSEPAPLTILTPGDAYDAARPRYVEEIAATLGVLGFDVRPVITDFDTVVDLAFSQTEEGGRQYDMYFLGWTLGNPALPDHYRSLFATEGAMNNTGYSSLDFDEQLVAYESAYTLQEARKFLWAMEVILARDLPYLLLYTTEITEAYRSDVVEFGTTGNIGGIQGRLGGITDVEPTP